MNYNEYKRTTCRELKGRKVRTLRELRNSWCVIPKGTICTITHKSGGLEIESEACPDCGVKVCISKVQPTSVELLPKEEKEGDTI